MPSFIDFTYSYTYPGASAPCSAISRTMALPTMAPSERSAIFFACAGVEMPKPTAQGMDVFARTSFTIAPMSVVISLRTPVTPMDDTMYKKPSASLAIIATRFSLVGAMRLMKSSPRARQAGANSSFSSNGTSGRIMPSMPVWTQRSQKRSMP